VNYINYGLTAKETVILDQSFQEVSELNSVRISYYTYVDYIVASWFICNKLVSKRCKSQVSEYNAVSTVKATENDITVLNAQNSLELKVLTVVQFLWIQGRSSHSRPNECAMEQSFITKLLIAYLANKFPALYKNPVVQYRLHNSPPLDIIRANSIHCMIPL
jgi:hypothetical protein